jgi:hypothetical protein
MAWTTLEYTRTQVDKAGDVLVAGVLENLDRPYDEYLDALDVINNWRSSHSFPLNTFTVGLKRRAREVDPDALVAQRIKRLSSIAHKLERFTTMKLSQMQDIGGCRAIVSTLREVKELVAIQKGSGVKHKLVKENNYIERPKSSGYRGVHLIYRYHSDRSEDYNGLQVEMQLRSGVQHAWATAVETVGTLVQQALKSSIGTGDWLRFFALMGTAIAWREGAPAVPGTPTTEAELVRELRGYADQRAMADRLRSYGAALHTAEQSSATDKNASYFLLKLDPSAQEVTVTGFKRGQLETASQEYLAVEKGIRGGAAQDAVLVSVDSVASLRRAYPNYFLDTTAFVELVQETIEKAAA